MEKKLKIIYVVYGTNKEEVKENIFKNEHNVQVQENTKSFKKMLSADSYISIKERKDGTCLVNIYQRFRYKKKDLQKIEDVNAIISERLEQSDLKYDLLEQSDFENLIKMI